MTLPALKVFTIPHGLQRYETVGDYWYKNENYLQVRISDMGNEDFEFLVLIHELVESYLCRRRGISVETIDKFDRDFELARPQGDTAEPGDAHDSPYQREHRFAERIERAIALELEVSWDQYENAVLALTLPKE